MSFPYGVHLITDHRRLGGRGLEETVEQALAGGVAAVHLREPEWTAAELFEQAERLRVVTEGRGALVINDRVDVALAAGADAVQLGRRSLPLAAARRIIGEQLLIGRSVHSVEEAAEAEREGADYVLLGTLYATSSHPDAVPAGAGLVRRVREAVRLPIIGIGGITAANAAEVMEAGADGIAVIGALLEAADVEAAARQIVGALSGER